MANYQKAFSLNPDSATGLFVNNEYGFLLVIMGKIQEARQTFENMIAQPDNAKKAKGYRSLGLLQMYQGKYSAAQDSLKEAVILNKTLKSKLSEIRDHLFLAINFKMKKQDEAFDKEIAEVLGIQKEFKIDPVFLFKIGKICARSNRVKEAAELQLLLLGIFKALCTVRDRDSLVVLREGNKMLGQDMGEPVLPSTKDFPPVMLENLRKELKKLGRLK